VTGWKGVFVNRGFTRRIQGVTKDESDVLLQYLFNVSLAVALLYPLDKSLTKPSS
jgi:alpha-ketoglutarate-dependent taurine dioxygenase